MVWFTSLYLTSLHFTSIQFMLYRTIPAILNPNSPLLLINFTTITLQPKKQQTQIKSVNQSVNQSISHSVTQSLSRLVLHHHKSEHNQSILGSININIIITIFFLLLFRFPIFDFRRLYKNSIIFPSNPGRIDILF